MKKIINRVLGLLSVAVLSIGVLAGCASDQNSETNPTTELKTIELGIPGGDGTYSGEIVNLAIKKGYIEEELNQVGYTANWNTFPSGAAITEALAGGSIVGGQLGDMPAFVSNSNGVGTTAIAITNNNLQYMILARNGLEISSPKDLEGKKIIVNQGTNMWRFWKLFTEAENLDTSTIEIINSNDAISLLSTGEVDAYVQTIATGKLFESFGVGKTVITGNDYPGSGSTTVFELEDEFLAENEAAAVAIDKAIIRAYRDAVANPDEFYESLASDNQPVEVIKAGYEGNEDMSQANPKITDEIIKAYREYSDFLVENQMLPVGVDVDKFANNTYYEKALAELDK